MNKRHDVARRVTALNVQLIELKETGWRAIYKFVHGLSHFASIWILTTLLYPMNSQIVRDFHDSTVRLKSRIRLLPRPPGGNPDAIEFSLVWCAVYGSHGIPKFRDIPIGRHEHKT
jgi:hypothetical protein